MTKLQEAHRYLNLLRSKPKRNYGFVYLAWLKNGCIGSKPKHQGLSLDEAHAVRTKLDEILINPLDVGLIGWR